MILSSGGKLYDNRSVEEQSFGRMLLENKELKEEIEKLKQRLMESEQSHFKFVQATYRMRVAQKDTKTMRNRIAAAQRHQHTVDSLIKNYTDKNKAQGNIFKL